MTQHLRRGTLAFSCATLVAMGGCFLTGPDDSIALDVSSLEIFVTESRSVVAADANVVPGSITWTSSDPRVATVDSEGLVVGVAVGTATIEARVGDIVNSVEVTVLALMNFVYPVNGVLNRDIFHVNYVGHTDAVGRTTDYQCGYRWGRATGSNIIAPSRAYLDSNVVVVAAAAGTVTEVHDGDPDLIINDFNPARILGNFVRLAHRDGFETIYGHLKQGSVGVMVGQVVEAAAPHWCIGIVRPVDLPERAVRDPAERGHRGSLQRTMWPELHPVGKSDPISRSNSPHCLWDRKRNTVICRTEGTNP